MSSKNVGRCGGARSPPHINREGVCVARRGSQYSIFALPRPLLGKVDVEKDKNDQYSGWDISRKQNLSVERIRTTYGRLLIMDIIGNHREIIGIYRKMKVFLKFFIIIN